MTAQSHQWNTSLYDDKHAFVWKRGEDLIELLAPREGERILDLGCGTGHLTRKIADSGAEVIGLDHSADMVQEARAQYPELNFRIGDARNFDVEQPVDAVFSNAVLHWVKPPEAVIARIWAALKPGGRFVAEFGGEGNVRLIERAMHLAVESIGCSSDGESSWYFPSIGEYGAKLQECGFDVVYAVLFDRPTELEGVDGLRNWIKMFGQRFLAQIPPKKLETIFQKIEQLVRPALYRNGKWFADYRRLRVMAYRSGGEG